jgi:Arc/MetJ-type ribon-helix-helix transcriptional regulator
MPKNVVIEKIVRVKIAEELLAGVDRLVNDGWFPNRDSVLAEALKRYLSTHKPEAMEKHIRDDVEWALRGGK